MAVPRALPHHVCSLLLLLLLFPACAATNAADSSDTDDLIGRPPPPEEDDPFFARALPAEAVAAAPSGHIGDPSPRPDPPEPPPVEIAPRAQEEVPDAEQEPAQKEPEEQTTLSKTEACFSCVQICPLDNQGRPSCDDQPDDLICGWGSHPDVDIARRTAIAHCDSTLDMARQMPTYLEISGSCPPATCR